MALYSDNSGAIINSKESRKHKREKHIERRYHLLREIVHKGDIIVSTIDTAENLGDPFTKALATKVFIGHLKWIGLRNMSHPIKGT